MFVMNFKEIHSNTEFLSTYRRAREIPLTGEMSRSDKRVCRIADLLLPKKINSNIYRKKTRTLSPCLFWHFPSFARGQYQRTAPARKIRNLPCFLKVYLRVEIYNLTFFYTQGHFPLGSVQNTNFQSQIPITVVCGFIFCKKCLLIK